MIYLRLHPSYVGAGLLVCMGIVPLSCIGLCSLAWYWKVVGALGCGCVWAQAFSCCVLLRGTKAVKALSCAHVGGYGQQWRLYYADGCVATVHVIKEQTVLWNIAVLLACVGGGVRRPVVVWRDAVSEQDFRLLRFKLRHGG